MQVSPLLAEVSSSTTVTLLVFVDVLMMLVSAHWLVWPTESSVRLL